MPHSSSSDPPAARTLDCLAVAAREGDRRALERLLFESEPRLVRMALAFGAPPDDAPDLVQEALLAAWRRLEDYDPAKGSFLAWVASGVRGRVLNLRRGRGRLQSFLDRFRDQPEPELDQPHGAVDARITLAKLLSVLTPRQREVVGLYELGEFSGRETAQILGIAEASVRSIARDARAQLKAVAEKENGETSQKAASARVGKSPSSVLKRVKEEPSVGERMAS